ncbi:hypothetical protein [Aeromonas veronii]|uniref:hypothetical protein n=1 Tax=Aeromonas veronii TaxID=654 RepID=UPI003B9E4099
MESVKKYASWAIKIIIVFPMALLTASTIFFGIIMLSSGVVIDWGQTAWEVGIKIVIGGFFYWVANKLHKAPEKPNKPKWQHPANMPKSDSDRV